MAFTFVDLFALLLALLPFSCLAAVEFVQPAPGSSLPPPLIDVQWKDSGTWPPLSELIDYTLILMTGGNEEDNMLPIQTFASSAYFSNSNNGSSGRISFGIAESIDNGFFFKIASSSSQGKQIINYSDRFSITGLTGDTPPEYQNAIAALGGSTQGPAGSVPGSASLSASATLSTSSIVGDAQTVYITPTSTGAVQSSATSKGALPTSSNSSKSHSSGTRNLPTGVSIGIGIACGVVSLVILALATHIVRRQYRKRKFIKDDFSDPMSKPELPAEGSGKRNTKIGFTQLGSKTELVEVDGRDRTPEMDDMNIKFELEGDMPPIVEAGIGRRSVHQ